MPKLLQINVDSALYSCGKICEDISKVAQRNGWETWIAYGREHKDGVNKEIKIGSWADVYLHWAVQRVFDNEGRGSRRATRKLVEQIKEIDPDLIHIHLIHDHYLNYPVLFEYLSKAKIPVVWTQHDCWNLTGHCYHFVSANCDRWKTECHDCPLIHSYPNNLLDRSRKNYLQKREAFTSVENLNIVSCSHWLDGFVAESFLQNKNHLVIHNGVDINRFKPTVPKREKFTIIGVALPWSKAKGIDDYFRLREILPQEDYDIIMVGLSPEQKKSLPAGIIGIERTHNVDELVELYSSSHALVNTTYADNFPTINIEALACGTPVITYMTGGSPEAIDEKTGMVVEQGNIDALAEAIKQMRENPLSSDDCRKRAVEFFDKDKCFEKYIELYNKLLRGD